MDVPRRGFLGGGTVAQRVGRARRIIRSGVQRLRRRGGRNVRAERAGDIVGEGRRGRFGRRR